MKKTNKELAEQTRARQKKQNEYIKNSFDRVSVVMPKGYKDRINAASGDTSLNAFIVDAISEKLARTEAAQNSATRQREPIPAAAEILTGELRS